MTKLLKTLDLGRGLSVIPATVEAPSHPFPNTETKGMLERPEIQTDCQTPVPLQTPRKARVGTQSHREGQPKPLGTCFLSLVYVMQNQAMGSHGMSKPKCNPYLFHKVNNYYATLFK